MKHHQLQGDGLRLRELGLFVKGGGVASIINDSKGRLIAAFQWFPSENEEAFDRIAENELGIKPAYEDADFLGVFEHLYHENFAGQQEFGTHYVVLAYQVEITKTPLKLPETQHSRYEWFDRKSLRNDKKVHPYTKAYFRNQQ